MSQDDANPSPCRQLQWVSTSPVFIYLFVSRLHRWSSQRCWANVPQLQSVQSEQYLLQILRKDFRQICDQNHERCRWGGPRAEWAEKWQHFHDSTAERNDGRVHWMGEQKEHRRAEHCKSKKRNSYRVGRHAGVIAATTAKTQKANAVSDAQVGVVFKGRGNGHWWSATTIGDDSPKTEFQKTWWTRPERRWGRTEAANISLRNPIGYRTIYFSSSCWDIATIPGAQVVRIECCTDSSSSSRDIRSECDSEEFEDGIVHQQQSIQLSPSNNTHQFFLLSSKSRTEDVCWHSGCVEV